jgi:hypothetical protein
VSGIVSSDAFRMQAPPTPPPGVQVAMGRLPPPGAQRASASLAVAASEGGKVAPTTGKGD